MFDEFDPFDHSGDDGNIFHHDDGQHDYSQDFLLNQDNLMFNTDFRRRI